MLLKNKKVEKEILNKTVIKANYKLNLIMMLN